MKSGFKDIQTSKGYCIV